MRGAVALDLMLILPVFMWWLFVAVFFQLFFLLCSAQYYSCINAVTPHTHRRQHIYTHANFLISRSSRVSGNYIDSKMVEYACFFSIYVRCTRTIEMWCHPSAEILFNTPLVVYRTECCGVWHNNIILAI